MLVKPVDNLHVIAFRCAIHCLCCAPFAATRVEPLHYMKTPIRSSCIHGGSRPHNQSMIGEPLNDAEVSIPRCFVHHRGYPYPVLQSSDSQFFDSDPLKSVAASGTCLVGGGGSTIGDNPLDKTEVPLVRYQLEGVKQLQHFSSRDRIGRRNSQFDRLQSLFHICFAMFIDVFAGPQPLRRNVLIQPLGSLEVVAYHGVDELEPVPERSGETMVLQPLENMQMPKLGCHFNNSPHNSLSVELGNKPLHGAEMPVPSSDDRPKREPRCSNQWLVLGRIRWVVLFASREVTLERYISQCANSGNFDEHAVIQQSVDAIEYMRQT
jgi:hypothetical protein